MTTGLPASTAILDHMVYNVRLAMDEAQAQFAKAGFQLTERGYHTLGSINHLMILDTDYVELIGLPSEDAAGGRMDIARAPYGLNGLVFKSDDVDATFAHLSSLGMAGDPPKSFSRPVSVGGETRDACFRTVHVRGDVFHGGRVYFCEHATPELVWRDEWRHHDNGAASLDAFVIVARDPDAEAARYGALVGRGPEAADDGITIDLRGSRLLVQSPAQYAERFGAAATAMREGDAMFGALIFRSKAAATEGAFAALGDLADVQAWPNGQAVRLREFDAVMGFVDA